MPAWLASARRRIELWNRRRLHRRLQARMPVYDDWARRHDSIGPAESAALARRLAELPARPVVALLLDAGDSAPPGHAALLQSLHAQLYPAWRLHVHAGAAQADDWRGVPQAELGPPPQGGWQARLSPDEVWREHTLLLLVEAALQHPRAVVVYADEDRLLDDGRRAEPWFKCDWNPALLTSHDCIGVPALLRSAAAPADPQGPPSGRQAAWLAVTDGLAAEQVVHVPHVLCHRRGAAPPSADAAAVQRHLGCTALPEPDGFDGVRVLFPLPAPAPPVTVIVPTRNGLALLRRCVDSILARTDYPSYEIVIVDNGSDDPACLRWLRRIAENARVRVRRDDSPFNFAALNNAAVAAAGGEFVALVNNDIEVMSSGWLREMVSLAARPGAGCVGARLWYGDGTLQHGGVILGIGSVAGHAHKRLPRHQPGMGGRARRLQNLSAVTAACLVVRRSTWLQVGGMDAEHFAVAFNDIDFCLRLRALGLQNAWTPHAELYHHESVSRGRDRAPANQTRFLRERDALQSRWGHVLRHDPAYNPNLTFTDENFALADPPRVSLLRRWFETDGKLPT